MSTALANTHDLVQLSTTLFRVQSTTTTPLFQSPAPVFLPIHNIAIDGLRVALKPHQAFAAFYMLRSERRRHGGFLADVMGLGKVYSCYNTRLRFQTQAIYYGMTSCTYTQRTKIRTDTETTVRKWGHTDATERHSQTNKDIVLFIQISRF